MKHYIMQKQMCLHSAIDARVAAASAQQLRPTVTCEASDDVGG
jgi:hypothetical protein